MTQGNQVAGFFGGLNACDARNPQHVALFGGALQHQIKCAGQHVNVTGGDGHPVGRGFGRHVDHMGLPVGVKMGQSHGVSLGFRAS